ncbi:aminotransferase class III-fold pyridoxal phosphate-dependent enzyme, partial [Pseudomonas syringae]
VLGDHPQVLEIRGRGLMIGIELQQVIPELTRIAAEQHGLLINVTRSKVIRLLPPLVLDAAEVEQIVQRLAATLDSAGQRVLKRTA